VLLLVDGTWRQAKEMFDALQTWLLKPEGPGQQVQLPTQQQQQQQQQQVFGCADKADLPVAAAAADQLQSTAALWLRDTASRIRTEPAEGACTTLEATAAAVAILEGDPALFDIVMKPLRLVTAQQAGFDPAIAARLAPGGSGVAQSKKKLGMRNRLAP
jgi:hypothetical protein